MQHFHRSSPFHTFRGSRLGPALTLGALTAIVAMFVVSSLNGCRRDAELSTETTVSVDRARQPRLAENPRYSGAMSPSVPEEGGLQREVVPSSFSDGENEEHNPAEADAVAQDRIENKRQSAAVTSPDRVTPPIRRARLLDEDLVPGVVDAPDLHVNRLAAAANVEGRRPKGVATQFPANGESVWAWASLKNDSEGASHVWMVWKQDGKVRSRVKLKVGKSPRWRTWSRFRMRSRHIGSWVVETTSPSGALLDTITFDVVGTDTAKAGVAQSDIAKAGVAKSQAVSKKTGDTYRFEPAE